MSAAWTERQGQVGDLRSKNKDELAEILQRQEKLLNNKRFINTLPDKGKKISEFTERVRQALAHVEEKQKKSNDLLSVQATFQDQYQQALASRQPQQRASAPDKRRPERKQFQHPQENELAAHSRSGNHENCQHPSPNAKTATVSMESPLDVQDCKPTDINDSMDGTLAETLARVSLSELRSGESCGSSSGDIPANPFGDGQKRPHYMEVVERAERTPSTAARHKFKPNQLLGTKTGTPSPGGGSPGDEVSPLSAEARRQRDRKHLDDITAAKLPPLHHTPAQLLTLQEAAQLMREQTHKQMELEVRMAAQKLSEGLRSSMGAYHPEGGSLGAYREPQNHHDQDHDDEGASDND